MSVPGSENAFRVFVCFFPANTLYTTRAFCLDNVDLMFTSPVHPIECVKTYRSSGLMPDLERYRLGDFVGGHQEAQFF